MQRLLEAVEFRNPSRAREDIARLGNGIPERITARIQSLLASVPDPDEALHFLERLRQDYPAAFNRISSSPAALRCLITTFSYSRFLSEAVLQRPEWLLQAADPGDLHRMLSAEEFAERLQQFRAAEGPDLPAPVMLARFRRRQLLRILLRDVLGLAALPDITGELSNLADAILDFAYRQIREQLVARHGEPSFEGPDGQPRACGFAVIALGKLGGQELNYSSDIDLMFVYSANGETAGPTSITNKEFFKKVANQYTELLSTYTADGSCYRVDLRLRPDGRLGEVCISLDGAKRYYQERARDWEKQMLIKARVCAGDLALGRELLEFVEPLIYSTTLDFRAVEAVSETRERISEKLAAKRAARRRRRQADARRHSRYRVSGAVPAAPARRPRTLGAARRHAVRALARARQEPALGQRIRAPGFRVPVPAPPRAPAAVLRRPADAHAAHEPGGIGGAGAQDAGRIRRAAHRGIARSTAGGASGQCARDVRARHSGAQAHVLYAAGRRRGRSLAAARSGRAAVGAQQSQRATWSERAPQLAATLARAKLNRGRERFEAFSGEDVRRSRVAGAPGRGFHAGRSAWWTSSNTASISAISFCGIPRCWRSWSPPPLPPDEDADRRQRVAAQLTSAARCFASRATACCVRRPSSRRWSALRIWRMR